jgi:hypothetical protein
METRRQIRFQFRARSAFVIGLVFLLIEDILDRDLQEALLVLE